MKFIDARNLENGSKIDTDLCIVGAGAAGIALACEFIGTRWDVCLLDGGGIETDAATQALHDDFESVGYPPAPNKTSRWRYYGGTTNTWGGKCVLLEPVDYAERAWVPGSGWPVTAEDMMPYCDRAAAVLKIPNPEKLPGETWHDDPAGKQLSQKPLDLKPIRWAQALKMGPAYRDCLEAAQNVRVLLRANVTELETNPEGKAVVRLQARCLEGNAFSVRAKIYILACGGLENPRILLNSRQHSTVGIGNDRDLVGRYFMEHPKEGVSTRIVPLDNDPKNGRALYLPPLFGTPLTKLMLGLTAEAQEREGILNHATCVTGATFVEYETRGGQGFNKLRQGLQEKQAAATLVGATQMALDPLASADLLLKKVRQLPLTVESFVLTNQLEQYPNPDSRITLSDDRRDPFGKPVLKMDWKIDPREVGELRRFLTIVDGYLRDRCLGQLQSKFLEDPSYEPFFKSANHHTGTTRMGESPATSVVDANCQVHGVANLYVSSSSVFPTSGSANPTLTIVALAVRLADHLKASQALETAPIALPA